MITIREFNLTEGQKRGPSRETSKNLWKKKEGKEKVEMGKPLLNNGKDSVVKINTNFNRLCCKNSNILVSKNI